MDIEVVSTGEKIFKCDDGAARALIAAFPEAFKRVERPQFNAAPPINQQPRWVVNKNPYTDKVRIVLTKGNETLQFPGPNGGTLEQALADFAKIGFPVPQQIVEDYCHQAGIQKEIDIAKWNAAESRCVQQG